MKKKVYGLLLIFSVCFMIPCMLGSTKAKAVLGVDPAGYKYTITGTNTCTVDGMNDTIAAQYNQYGMSCIYVPGSLNGYKVTAIAENAFSNIDKVTKIFIYAPAVLDVTKEYVKAGQTPVVYGYASNLSVRQYAASRKWAFVPFAQTTGVKVSVNTKTLRTATLTWGATAGIQYYTIEKYDSKKKAYVNIGQTRANVRKYVVGGLKPGSSYTFRVTPEYDADLFPFPGITSKSVKAVMKPAKVKSFKGKARRGAVTLSWKKGSNINGYQVQCLTHLKIKIKGYKPTYYTIKNIKSTKYKSLKNKGLVKGMRYSYRIRAYKKIGKKKVYSDFVYVKKIKCK